MNMQAMNDNPDTHHRRSIRLQGYDYAQAGAYFVTMVTQGRACLFGEIVDGVVNLNDAGRMVEEWWRELENKYANVTLDYWTIMPNHFHGILLIMDSVGADLRVCPDGYACTNEEN